MKAIERELYVAREQYSARYAHSSAAYQEACTSIPGGNTRSALFHLPFPLTMIGGRDATLWDADGYEYIDFLGDYTSALYGHSNPVIGDEIQRVLKCGISFGAHNGFESKLANAVTSRFPSIEQLRFTHSGTEANLLAVSTARAITQRDKILVFYGGYHGGVLNFSTGHSPINAPFPFIIGRYNDTAGTLALLERHGSELAAVLLEPMLGSGGCIPGEFEFIAAIREATLRHGIVLIFDEVMTSRLSGGGLQELIGIQPDITTLGKYLGGGLPLGAFGGRRDIMGTFDLRRTRGLSHSGTFNNNVLALAAGLAGLSLYGRDVATRHNASGDCLRQQLNELARSAGVQVQFTGIGSMLFIHLGDSPIRSPDDVPTPSSGVVELFFFDMVRQGFWVGRRGMLSLSLPLAKQDYVDFLDAVASFIDRYNPLLVI